MRAHALRAAALVALLATACLPAQGAVDDDVDAILAKLRQPTVDELWTAQRRLTELGAEAVPVLESRLPKAGPAARLALAKALCDLGHPEAAVEPLAALVRDGASPHYAVAAAAALGESPARNVAATERHLVRLVEDTTLHPAAARAAARALWFTATSEENLKRANRVLRRLLVMSEGAAERRACALALAEIEDLRPPVDGILKELQTKPTAEGRLARALLENDNLKSLLISPKNREGQLNDRLLQEVKKQIQRYHVEDPPADLELVNGAARGMVEVVRRGDPPDPHSAYFDEEDWKQFREHISGHYGGIGAVVQFLKHFDTGEKPVFTVVRPNYAGPAYEAGIRSYDRIVEVDGEPTAPADPDDTSKRLKEIVEALRGKPGEPVKVTVTRPGEKQRRTVEIVRADIDLPSVHSRMLPARLGYVRLSAFSAHSARDLDKALRELEEQGMVGLVLDLRNNPGGQLSAAVAITDMFLKDDKLIVYTEGRNKEIAPREEFRTKDPTTHPDYPIVVLVNGRSASASEILAGALRDHKRAVLVGEKTYGKGSVQKLFPMRATAGQSGLKLTIAKYYLPSGRSIHDKGVHPNIEVGYKPTFRSEEFDHLRESGAFYRYTASRFAANSELFAKLAEFDGLQASRYPDFQLWYDGLSEEMGREKARRLLRAWLRVLVADHRGRQFVCDVQEDNQLQRAVLVLASRFEEIDPATILRYRHFAKPAAAAQEKE
ncbi:MAG: S41 family peptidase [Candidatus Brocadiia bacterium]